MAPLPSPPRRVGEALSGLTIEDCSHRVRAGGIASHDNRSRAVASRGITCQLFRPRGEVMLLAEDAVIEGGGDGEDVRSPSFAAAGESFGGVSSVSNTSVSFAPSGDDEANDRDRDVSRGLLLGRLESNRYAVPDDLLPVDDLLPLDEEETLEEEEEEEALMRGRVGNGNEDASFNDDASPMHFSEIDNDSEDPFACLREPISKGRPSMKPARRQTLSLRRTKSIQARDEVSIAGGKTILFPGAFCENDDPLHVDHDEEIFLDGGSRLVWSSGGVTRLKTVFPEHEIAKQATWVFFPEESSAFVRRERESARRLVADSRREFVDGVVRDDRPAVHADADTTEARDRGYRNTEAARDAFCESFSWFRGVKEVPTLCVRLQKSIWTHTPGGATQTAPLPKDQLGDFFPTAMGLLMRTRTGLFALRHPLDEPLAVVAVEGADSSVHNNETTRSVPAPTECLVWSSYDSVFILTHDPTRKAHALWRVAPCTSAYANAADAPFDDGFDDEFGDERRRPGETTDVCDERMDDASEILPENKNEILVDFETHSQSVSPARLSLRRVWTEPKGFAERPAKFVGIAHDDDDKTTPRLCVLGGDGVLRGYSFVGVSGDGSSAPTFFFSHARVKTASLVEASRAKLTDVAAVTDEGLFLLCGKRVAMTWRNDTPLFMSPFSDSERDTHGRGDDDNNGGGQETASVVASIVGLHSHVGSRVTAELRDGTKIRLTLPAAPRSPAVATVLRAIDASLDCAGVRDAQHGTPGANEKSLTTMIQSDINTDTDGTVSRAHAMEIVLAAAAEAGSPNEEWGRVCVSLLSWCGCDSYSSSNVMQDDLGSKQSDDDDGDGTNGDDDDDAWGYLLRSEWHKETAGKYPSLALAAAAEKSSSGICGGNVFPGRVVDVAGANSAPSVTPKSERSAPRLSKTHVERAMSLLRTTHAAYESCKLDVLAQPQLVPLRALCVKLATACAAQFSSADATAHALAHEAVTYLDHHAREAWFEWDLGVSSSGDDVKSGGGLTSDDANLAARTLAAAGVWSANQPTNGRGVAPDVCRALELVFTISEETKGTSTSGSMDTSTEKTAHQTDWRSLVPKPVLNEMRRFSDDETTPTRAPGTSITWCANILAFAELSARADAAAAVGDVHAAITLAETTAIAMTRAGFGLSELERVPSLLGLRLRDTMRLCRCFPPDNWPAQAYALVGRDDLAMAQSAAGGGRGAGGAREDLLEGMSTRRPNPTTSASPSAVDTRVRLVPGDGAGDTEDSDLDLGNGGNHDDGSGGNGQGNTQGEQGGSGDGDATTAHDGMSHLARFIGPLLFARDLRLREVRFLLGSSSPTPISLSSENDHAGDGSETGDPEAVVAQQQRLWALAPRTAALAVGRGAFTLGTARCRPTETLKIPVLTLAGCLPTQRGAVVALDLTASGTAGAEFTHWPEFHNGVASGLALAAQARGELTRSWILFNKPETPSNAHAGVLLALGITGALKQLSNTDLYRYLVQEHDLTTVAALLGTACAWRGSAKNDVAKMCFLHVPAVHPVAFPEVEVSLLAQSAALVSIGLLYQQTSHRRTVEIVLREIGADPDRTSVGWGGGGGNETQSAHSKGGREGYALCAGFALGLTCLGVGKTAVGLSDLRIVERLKRYLGGGDGGGSFSTTGASIPGGRGGNQRDAYQAQVENSLAGNQGQSSVDLLSSDANGGVDGWSAEDVDPLSFEDLFSGGDGTGGVGSGADDADGTDGTNAGNNASTNQSGNSGGAGGTGGQIMRGGAMINVDATSPGAALALGLMFLKTNDSSVADLLNPPGTHYALDHVRPDFVLTRVCAKALIMWDSVEPSIDWMEGQLPPLLRPPLTKIAGSAFYEPRTGSSCHPKIGSVFDAFADDNADREALAQAHVHALAGACMALGLRFAGTANGDARRALRTMTLRFLAMKAAAAAGKKLGELVDRPTLETCVCVSATALATVMAGTGDIDTFRVLRRLRLRLDRGRGHGANAANAGATAAATSATTGNGGASGLSYGAHCSVASAIGFLFLGGGTMRFATDAASVASLWLATYPRFPQNASDNRCHLQAFRHLYALASRRRLLETVDAASGVSVTAPVEIATREFSVTQSNARSNARTQTITTKLVTTPFLLPDPTTLVSLKVVGDRYWPSVVDGSAGASVASGGGSRASQQSPALKNLYATRKLPVQRLAGALPYTADPTGARAGVGVSLSVVHASHALKPPPPPGPGPGPGGTFSLETDSTEKDNAFENAEETFDYAVRAANEKALENSRLEIGSSGGGTNGNHSAAATHGDVFGAFVQDPASVGFARLMCGDAIRDDNSGGDEKSKKNESRLLQKTSLASFCVAALRECASLEEPSATSAYIDAYASAGAVRGAVEACLFVTRSMSNSTSQSMNDSMSTSPINLPINLHNSVRPVLVDDARSRIKRALTVADVAIGAATMRVSKVNSNVNSSDRHQERLMPSFLASGFRECTRDALGAMGFDLPGKELCSYYKGDVFCAAVPAGTSSVGDDGVNGNTKNHHSNATKPKDIRGLFGTYLKAFGLPSAPAVRRALAKFGLGPPGSGLDPASVVVALAKELPETNPEAVLRVARCGL